MVYETLPDGIKEVDVIIAGCDAAGWVVAARLADPELSILVTERGPNSFDVPTVVQPALFLSTFILTSKETIFYQRDKETQLVGRGLIVPSGEARLRLLENDRLVYRRDVAIFAKGAFFERLLYVRIKNFRRIIDYQLDKHGFTCPINISSGTWRAERPEQGVIQAAERVRYPEIPILTILDTNNSVTRALRYIGTDGKRQNTSSRYLRPRLESEKYLNLHVIVNTHVKRVLLADKRASGVEYIPNVNTNPGTSPRTI